MRCRLRRLVARRCRRHDGPSPLAQVATHVASDVPDFSVASLGSFALSSRAWHFTELDSGASADLVFVEVEAKFPGYSVWKANQGEQFRQWPR